MGGVNAKAIAAVNRLYPLEVRQALFLFRPCFCFSSTVAFGSQDGDNATIPNVDPATLVEEEEAFESYDDEDEAIDKYTQVVWENYCKKGEQFMTKKVAQQFFKDALILLGYRKNKETKVLLGQTKEKDALETAFAYLSQDGKTVTFDKWKDFINMADLNEILKLCQGQHI